MVFFFPFFFFFLSLSIEPRERERGSGACERENVEHLKYMCSLAKYSAGAKKTSYIPFVLKMN